MLLENRSAGFLVEREEHMEDLLVKIYQSVICNEKASIKMGKQYDEQIDKIIKKYKENTDTIDDDQIKARLYDVAYMTEQGGFILGACFMAKFLFEVMKMETE